MTEATENTTTETYSPAAEANVSDNKAAGPTLNVSEASKTLTVEELEAKLYQRGLSVEEMNQLLDKKAEENPNEGKLSQNTKKNVPWRDLKKAEIKEEDIIDAMYKGMMDMFLEVEVLGRKVAVHGWDKLKASGRDSNKDKDKKEKDFDLDRAFKKRDTEITKQSTDNIRKAKDIAQAIANGTLFDEKNKDLCDEFKKMTKDDPLGEKIMQHAQQACETYKATPDSADRKQNKENCEDIGKTFFAYSTAGIFHEARVQHTANNMAYAEALHKNELRDRPKEMQKTFEDLSSQYYENISRETKNERRQAAATMSSEAMTSEQVQKRTKLSTMYNGLSPRTAFLEKESQEAIKFARKEGKKTQENPNIEGVRKNIGMKTRQIEQQKISGTLNEVATQLNNSDLSQSLNDVDSRIADLDARANSPERSRREERIHRLRNKRNKNGNEESRQTSGNDLLNSNRGRE